MAMPIPIASSLCTNLNCSYSSPLLTLPISLPLLHNHNRQNRPSSFRTHGYGYGYGYGFYSDQHYHHQVYHQASKKPLSGEDYEEEEEEHKQKGEEWRWMREEQRWVREEQRWVREEQRWVREEARWNAERESMLRQISDLTLKIQHLELEFQKQSRLLLGSTDFIIDSETLSKAAKFLMQQNPNPNNSPLVLEGTKTSEPDIHSPIVTPTATPTPTSNNADKQHQQQRNTASIVLRMGCQGEEVQALQEALLSLGFYCGEEDMEYSSFSSATQRAVKTWQASIGRPEDGIMTAELLERLYAIQQIQNSGSSANPHQTSEDLSIPKEVRMKVPLVPRNIADEANGAPIASVTEVRQVQQTIVKKGLADVETSRQRVFLLGENRWEEPSRLRRDNDNKDNGIKTRVSATKCRACRGEGRLMCTECDGSGEPNIEPQFLEWVEEGAECPYCEGLGYTVCDVCQGRPVA